MSMERPLGQMIIELGLDSGNFTRGMKGINQQVKTSMNEMKAHLNVMSQSGSEIDKLKAKQTGLTNVIAAQNSKVSLAKERYEACKEAVEGNSKATQRQKDALIKAQNEYVKAIGELGSYESQLKDVTIRLTAMESGLHRVGTALSTFGNTLSGIGEITEKAGKSLTLGVTTPIIALGTYAVKTTAEFDASMSQVSAVSGAVGEDFSKLREKAREMGEQTKFSASEAAEAMNYMAMAGWKTEDMLGGIEGIMNLAAASGESLATTSDIVTDALTGFGKGAEDAGHLADIMAAASSNANTNVAMMGETFKYCTPIAGALGFSMEDTAEAIGLMANSGVKASMAGTAMRSMMNNLAGEVELAGEAFGETTIKTQNADGSMRDLNAILAECRTAFSQMTSAEQAANAEALVGKNAMSGFLAIMNAAPQDIEKLNAAIANCDGAAGEMAETVQDNLKGQLTTLKSQTDELAISFGDIMMPKIREIVSGAQKAADAMNGMSDRTKNIIVTVGLFSATVGPTVLVVGKLTKGIGDMASGIGKGMQSLSLWMSSNVAATAATEANTAATARNTVGLTAKTVKTIADAAASKAHAAAERARNIAISAGNGALTAQVTALNASIIAKGKDTAAAIAHTAAEKTRSITIGITTANLSAQTIATAAQTTATNACAVATGLLSAALKVLTGPIGWIVAGVTALTAGTIAAVKWLTRETEASKKLKAEAGELKDANESLTRSLDSSRESYEDHVKTIEAEASASKSLADKVTELSKTENKSAKQKKELQVYVGMLNNSVKGLNLQYDEQADALNLTTNEIYNQIDALDEQAKTQAAGERMVEILKEEMRVREQLSKVQEQIADATQNESLRNREKKAVLEELTSQEEALKGQLDGLEESYSRVSYVIAQSAQTESEAVAGSAKTILEAYGSIANAYEDLGERQKAALDNIVSAYETMTGKLSDLTEKIELDNETTWAKIRENQADTIEKTREFSELYAQLIEAGVSESYLNAIGATGPESIPLLKDMLSQGVEAVLESQADWQAAYSAISDTLVETFKINDSTKDAIREYIVGDAGIYGTLQAAVDDADLDALGESITEGVRKGILEGTEHAADASTEMAEAVSGAAEDAWEINSPSKKFARMGQYLMEGLLQGISRSEGEVYAKAKSVADRVTETMKSALQIHSPSVVMRDEVGRNIALGLAEGIEQNKDYAKKSAEDIASAVVQAARTRLDNTKVYRDLTLADETAYWDEVRVQVKEGTQARIDADKQYYEAKKSLDQKMVSLETDYTSKVKKAYADLEQNIKSLRDAYESELTSRTKDIAGAMGLFDEFTAKTELSTSDMIKNLKSQVNGLAEWTNNLSILERRGIGDDLLEELRGLGTGAAGEVALMTQMTDEELSEYVSLFKQKQRLARQEAAEELEPMLEETEEQISRMQREVSQELEEYKDQFVQAMMEIGAQVQTPLEQIQNALMGAMSSAVSLAAGTVSEESDKTENVNQFGELASSLLKTAETLPGDFANLGQDTVEGLIQGIRSKAEELCQTMAEIIKGAIEAAREEAQIHSPSKVMMSLGSYMMQGFGIGMENMQEYIEGVARQSAQTVSNAFRTGVSSIEPIKISFPEDLLTEKTGAIASINRALSSEDEQWEKEHTRISDMGSDAGLIEKLLQANEKIIKLLEEIADKNMVIDRRAMTDVVDTGLEGRKMLRERGA